MDTLTTELSALLYTSSGSYWQTGKPVHLITFAGLLASFGWLRPAHNSRRSPAHPSIDCRSAGALLHSPITLDAPPTPFSTGAASGSSEHVGQLVELLDTFALPLLAIHEFRTHSLLVPFDHLHAPALDGLQLLCDGRIHRGCDHSEVITLFFEADPSSCSSSPRAFATIASEASARISLLIRSGSCFSCDSTCSRRARRRSQSSPAS